MTDPEWLEFSKETGRRGYSLGKDQLKQLIYFHELLCEANLKFNLTRITGLCEAILKHYLDSYLISEAVSQVYPGKVQSLLDFGSGSGVPGIPLKIFLDIPSLLLVDARKKKVDYLKKTCQCLGFDSVQAIHANWNPARSKAWARSSGRVDFVTARAVGAIESLLEILAPVSRKALILPRGPKLSDEEWQEADAQARGLGFLPGVRIESSIGFQGEEIQRNILCWVRLKA